MKATISAVATLAALSSGGPALAADDAAHQDVLDALEARAELPQLRPTLPDQASDRAREVQATTAFGQKGAAERAAHQAAEAAEDDSATKAARNAAEKAAEKANEKGQNAAAEHRANEVRKHVPPSKPNRGKPD